MGKFVFKFEPIKKIKETQEKQIQKEISLIDLEIQELEEKLEEVRLKILQTRDERAKKQKMSISELQFNKKFETILEIESVKIQQEITNRLLLRNKKSEELIQKVKEHKIFEKLKDIHQEEYIKENNKNEQISLDEMALNKFNKVNQ